jgi:hypothetical protein
MLPERAVSVVMAATSCGRNARLRQHLVRGGRVRRQPEPLRLTRRQGRPPRTGAPPASGASRTKRNAHGRHPHPMLCGRTGGTCAGHVLSCDDASSHPGSTGPGLRVRHLGVRDADRHTGGGPLRNAEERRRLPGDRHGGRRSPLQGAGRRRLWAERGEPDGAGAVGRCRRKRALGRPTALSGGGRSGHAAPTRITFCNEALDLAEIEPAFPPAGNHLTPPPPLVDAAPDPAWGSPTESRSSGHGFLRL